MSEVRYVQRDEQGTIIGSFANPQPGYAEEALAEDHPDILAFKAAREAKPAQGPTLAERLTALEKDNAALSAALVKAGAVTAEAIEAERPK